MLLLAALLASAALPDQAATPPPAPQVTSETPPAPAPSAPMLPPRLTIVISVDQFAADLFAEHRAHYTGGFARLLQGAVFPSAYQSHAATETCPGHSTILTGMRPAHTGIIANDWIDQSIARADKTVYCVEDPSVPGTDHDHYTVSDMRLRVPTLGETMKAANPASRVVSVAGKDRAAVMMGGHKVDEIWWWNLHAFQSYAGRQEPAVVTRANAATQALLARPQAALPLPDFCRASDMAVAVGARSFGQGRFARAGGDEKAFRASPAADASVFALAAGLIQEKRLGRGPAPDIIAIGASATDYIGHLNGNQGAEMCIQIAELDRTMGDFFAQLDAMGLDYQVVLTADHGAHDVAERQRQRAMPMDARVSLDEKPKVVGRAIGQALGIAGPVLLAADSDVYIDRALSPAVRARVLAEALRRYRAMPQVAGAFSHAEIAAVPMPSGPPEAWTLIERARASFDAERSGDFLVLLRPRVTTIADPATGDIATHGSPWDYDRRVPLLFWRKGRPGFEQPLSVETVDIAPTLAGTLGLATSGYDGRCLDLDPGVGDTCRP